MEEEESLKSSALVSQLSDPVQDKVDNLLPDSVVTPGVVVGGVLLAGDELLGVEKLAVDAAPHLVNDGRLKVHKHGPGHVLSRPRLREKSVEAVISASNSLIRGHLAIRLNS